MVEHRVQIELSPQLARGKTMQLEPQFPPAQEVGRTALDLAGTRAAQREVQAPVPG